MEQWRKRYQRRKELLTSCRESTTECPSAAQKFLAIVAEGRTNSGRARIGVINRAINLAIRPMSDFAQWGVEDRWTAPLVTLTSGLGDCEDYAIYLSQDESKTLPPTIGRAVHQMLDDGIVVSSRK